MSVVYFSITPTFEPSRYYKCWIVCFYYMNEIREDIHWYGQIFDKIGVKNKFAMNNDGPEKVVSRLIKEYGLLPQ